MHYNKLITNSNNKDYVEHCQNRNTHNNKDEIPPLYIDGSVVEDHQNIANIFSTYFTTVTDKMGANNLVYINASSNNADPLSYLYQVFTSQFPSIKLTPVTLKEIREIIKSLRWKNSHGYDDISMKILKISLPFIESPLTYICNRMLTTGIFPTRLKFSQIHPVFKKGNKIEISNYRPISLLTSFSKTFEKVIYKRLYCHINTNKILAREQDGFRSNSYTETAAYNLINNIIEALNSNKWVGGIFCDLTKAFDYVNHNILLSKLEFYGITGKAKNLIKSYLNDRYQRVRIKNKYLKNHFSEWEKVRQGVPQGSVLGPLFFLLYINDLPGIINDTYISKPTIFADDTNIIITNPKISVFKEEINAVVEKISNWFQTNLLILNFNKTYYMHFSARSKHLIDIQLSYKGNYITNTLSTRFLGLTLDSTMSWNLTY